MAKLYDLMDWAEIEAVIYSEEDHPYRILGPRLVKGGILIQCYFPGAKSVTLRTLNDHQDHCMTQEDEDGFFAILLKGKVIPRYVYVLKEDDEEKEYGDPYAYPLRMKEKDEKLFKNGIHYEIYHKLGAHPAVVDHVKGVYFAVWAPNALRVSLVGDFNHWDGRLYPMEKHEDSGIFEIFIPGLKTGDIYKYELKLHNGMTYLKADPYGAGQQLRPDTASVIRDLDSYQWQDAKWMKTRKPDVHQAMSVYQLQPGDFKRPESEKEFYNYRELAPMISAYVKEMGYTHIELTPIMEYSDDATMGYQTSAFYAPSSRYGSAEDFMAFVDHMHQENIAVFIEWVPAYFSAEDHGLAAFDGTMLYEHLDPRQGVHPYLGTHIFNYGRHQVSNYLIANAMYWADLFHVDGIRMAEVASMLYLDYGRERGGWVANMYGGNENLEALEFLHHLNSMMKKKYPDVLMIAGDTASWPQMTTPVEEGGLGFDYKWNEGWKNDLCEYFSYDPIYRGEHHDQITLSMIYAYSEKYVLALPHSEFIWGKSALLNRMPGDSDQKLANLRAMMAYMFCHPGKKLLYMGQDFAQTEEWSVGQSPSWELLTEEKHKKFHEYMKQLLVLYKKSPALYAEDYETDGFTWINAMEWEKNILTFLRKSKDQTYLVLCNFSALSYDAYEIGVPREGKYKEIFNSDHKKFGGSGYVNPRVKFSRTVERDGYENSIKVKVAPLSVAVFELR